MRYSSCKSLMGKRDRFNEKIKLISRRMTNLEKDIQEIKNNKISQILSTKNSIKNIISKNKKKNNRIKYISHNFNNNVINHKSYSINNIKTKHFSHTNSKNKMHIKFNYSYLPKEILEYEYEIRTLKRKLESLKSKNTQLNNDINNLREKNDFIEFNINSYRGKYDNLNFEESKNNAILDDINNIKYKKNLINNINELCEKNINCLNIYKYKSNKKHKNKEEYSIINMLLNLMDIKFEYENAILNNYFFQGLDLLFQNNYEKYDLINNKDKVFFYVSKLISKEKKLQIENKKYENIKKYYNIFKKFSNNNNLNKIIIKNIKMDQKLKKIKKVLKIKKLTKKVNGNIDLNKNKITEKFLKRNKNNSNYDIDKYYSYNSNYCKSSNKIKNHKKFNKSNYNYFLRNNDNIPNMKSNSVIRIMKNYNNETEFNNYAYNRNKKILRKMMNYCSKTMDKNDPKNIYKIYF